MLDRLTVNADNIEPAAHIAGDPFSEPVNVRTPADRSLLPMIHRFQRAAGFPSGSVFDFYKYKCICFSGNQVYFAGPAPEIVFQDPVSVLLKPGTGYVLISGSFCPEVAFL